jgi:streptogramin lyase
MSAKGPTLAVSGAIALLSLGTPGNAAATPAGAIVEFSAGLNAGSAPSAITPGADGNLWFTDEGTTPAIGRITPAGAITEFSAGLNAGSRPYGIATGPEGNLWFTDRGTTRAIGRITPAGAITEFSAGLNTGSRPLEITLGPDGNLWFTDRGTTPSIGRITPSGAITEFSAGLNEGAEPDTIAPGSDGNLWFTDHGRTPAIGEITPSGTITEFTAGLSTGSLPAAIAPGPNGNMWFTDHGSNRAIGEITPGGTITEFTAGLTSQNNPVGIAPGADGNEWFTDLGTTPAIGQVTPSGIITEFSAGLGPHSGPVSIAPGADGNLWFADQGASTDPAIGQVGTGAPTALASAPVISGSDLVGETQTCSAVAWSSWASLQPSTSLFSFDGYRWLLGGSEIATGPSYTPVETNVGQQLSCQVTVTYPLLDVTTSTTSAPVTVAPPTPVITNVRQSARSWREGAKLAHISSKHKPPVGTTISLTASEPVSATFTFTQLLTGRTVAGKCVSESKKNAKHRHCRRAVKVATLPLSIPAGTSHVVFQGRISARHKLAPGRYTLTLTATNSYGVSAAPQTLSFTIVKSPASRSSRSNRR